MKPMKCQVTVFFTISILAMVLKLCTGAAEDVVSYHHLDDNAAQRRKLYSETYKYFFVLNLLNLVADLCFSGLIISYLMSTAAMQRN